MVSEQVVYRVVGERGYLRRGPSIDRTHDGYVWTENELEAGVWTRHRKAQNLAHRYRGSVQRCRLEVLDG